MQGWYVHDKGATTGPFTTEQVRAQIAEGRFGELATYCVTGTTTWRTLRDLPELAPAKPTELPVMKARSCGSCQCPIAWAMKKVIFLAILAALAYFAWIKLGHHVPHTGSF